MRTMIPLCSSCQYHLSINILVTPQIRDNLNTLKYTLNLNLSYRKSIHWIIQITKLTMMINLVIYVQDRQRVLLKIILLIKLNKVPNISNINSI